MKKLWFALLLLPAITVPCILFGQSWPARDAWTTPPGLYRSSSEEFLRWVGNQHLVAGLRGQKITCFRLGRRKPLWSRTLTGGIEAVAASSERVYVFTDDKSSLQDQLQILESTTGKTLRAIPGDDLAKLCGVPFIVPGGLAWLADPGTLTIINSADEVDNVFFLDANVRKILSKAHAPDYTSHLSTGPGTLTLCKMTNQAHVIEAKTGHHIHHWGKGNAASPIDAIALKNAHGHADETLVLVRDHGGWVPGDVTVRHKGKPITFGSENHHAVTDLDWKHRQIALSGTSKNITIKSLEGKTVASIRNACRERVYQIAFSPDSKHLAVLSQAGEVHVFQRPD